jgi:apolipoprotein N-acyltransferase
MVGLAVALHTPGSSRLRGGLRGLLFGVAANVVALRFIPAVVTRFTPLPWAAGALALVLLAFFEGLRWSVAAMIAARASRVMPRWAAFALGVFVGSFVPTMLPWTAAGGVTPWPAMVQLAEIFGERGVAALMALTAGLIAEAILTRKPIYAAGLAIPLVTLAYGAWRIHSIDARRDAAPKMKVALVQPSIEARIRWEPRAAPGILDKLLSITRSAEQRGAELTVWPESAYPFPIAHASRKGPVLGLRHPVITGLVTNFEGGTYNSAAAFYPDGSMSEPQAKIRLLWFGETVPLADKISWMRTTFARGVGIAPGDHPVLITAGPARTSVLNCFEDTLPAAGLDAMTVDPNLLVNVTNDGWFHPSAEGELHLRLSVLRAVEQRRDLVRAVNNGPASWVDASGRVRSKLEPPLPGSIMADAALLEGRTIYGRFGDAPLLGLSTLGLLGAVIRRRRGSASHSVDGPGGDPA